MRRAAFSVRTIRPSSVPLVVSTILSTLPLAGLPRRSADLCKDEQGRGQMATRWGPRGVVTLAGCTGISQTVDQQESNDAARPRRRSQSVARGRVARQTGLPGGAGAQGAVAVDLDD